MIRQTFEDIHASFMEQEHEASTVSITVRVSPSLRDRLDRLVEYSDWSLSRLCESLLEEGSFELCKMIADHDLADKSEKQRDRYFKQLAYGEDKAA